MYHIQRGVAEVCQKMEENQLMSHLVTHVDFKIISLWPSMMYFTFLRHHGYHLEAHVFLHFQLKLAKNGNHFGDFLHHVADVLP